MAIINTAEGMIYRLDLHRTGMHADEPRISLVVCTPSKPGTSPFATTPTLACSARRNPCILQGDPGPVEVYKHEGRMCAPNTNLQNEKELAAKITTPTAGAGRQYRLRSQDHEVPAGLQQRGDKLKGGKTHA